MISTICPSLLSVFYRSAARLPGGGFLPSGEEGLAKLLSGLFHAGRLTCLVFCRLTVTWKLLNTTEEKGKVSSKRKAFRNAVFYTDLAPTPLSVLQVGVTWQRLTCSFSLCKF